MEKEMSVVFIDKPKGPTSFDIVEMVSRMMEVGKAGHTGTLDPNATGVMVIALGEARKAMPVLTGLDKEYEGTIKLHDDIKREKIEKALNSFRGKITQLPPVRSAVARKERERTVHEIEILEFGERALRLRILCEAGTYIRKIAHDLGEAIGCGAHLTELRRTKVGPFVIGECVTLETLEKKRYPSLSLEDALHRISLPEITIKNGFEEQVRNGSPIRKEFIKGEKGTKKGKYAAVFSEKGKIVCLATYLGEESITAKTERVFLEV